MAAKIKVFLSWSVINPDGTEAGDDVLLDASVSESHGDSASVTEHQVETGSNITDHIRPLPKTLTIDGVITNTPVETPVDANGNVNQTGGAKGSSKNIDVSVTKKSFSLGTGRDPALVTGTATYKAFSFDQFVDRVKNIHSSLEAALATGAIFTITTSLRQYESMAAERYSVSRNAQSGNSLVFTIQFKQIRFVDTQEVETPAKKQSTVKRGNKAAKTADKKTTEDTRTVAGRVSDALSGAF